MAVQDNARARGPKVDPDELIRGREEELASGKRWRVRLGCGDLWWDSIGGYTPLPSNAKKWPCGWDAYNFMLEQRTGEHTWEIELIPRAGPRARGLAGGARFGDLSQAWTRSVSRGGRPVPEDGEVHALVGVNVPGVALCGESVGLWFDRPWPPRGMRRCEKCNSLALTLPGD